jgi:hypothetical protein
VKEEEDILERLETSAKELDSIGEGELSEEDLCAAVNQQEQLKISAEEVGISFYCITTIILSILKHFPYKNLLFTRLPSLLQ